MAKKFVDEFIDAVNKMEEDAKKAGTNLTTICKLVGAGRATPDLWRKKPPKTIMLLTEMQKAVEEYKK